MDREAIEQYVREFQMEIWNARDGLFAGVVLPSAHRIFTAEIAAKFLGVTYELHAGLGSVENEQTRFEVAGFIDRERNKIAISQRLDPLSQRFTGAHEVGHWKLHADNIIRHRDRPIAGLGTAHVARSRVEREADYFAACLLVPRKLLRHEFETRFGEIDKFRCNDDAAFGLCPSAPRSLLASSDDSLEWELALATAIRYHGQYLESLADLFLVSPMTMAIRLREVGLRR